MNIFNENLKKLRSDNGLSQKQLAEILGASERGIQNYEYGFRNPPFDLLIAIADYFDVSIDYLVGRTGNPNSHKN